MFNAMVGSITVGKLIPEVKLSAIPEVTVAYFAVSPFLCFWYNEHCTFSVYKAWEHV